MHVLFEKFTLHTHPIAVNVVACRQNWAERFKELFPDCLCVPYATPGIRLALALNALLEACGTIPRLIFIQNHGMITTGKTVADVESATEKAMQTLESGLNFSQDAYKLTTNISKIINEIYPTFVVASVSTDRVVNRVLQFKT